MFSRHTSRIENFNSLILKYAPKRVGFQWVYDLPYVLTLYIIYSNFTWYLVVHTLFAHTGKNLAGRLVKTLIRPYLHSSDCLSCTWQKRNLFTPLVYTSLGQLNSAQFNFTWCFIYQNLTSFYRGIEVLWQHCLPGPRRSKKKPVHTREIEVQPPGLFGWPIICGPGQVPGPGKTRSH
jgi:hypothetical protein